MSNVQVIPHNWRPERHHLEVFRSPARYKVLVWHRKARKTTAAINELIRWCYAAPGTYWYVAPYYGQAKKIVWDDPNMLAHYCPPSVWDKRNNSELKLTFPNGSVLYVLGADKPDSLRGPNPKGVVLDEYGDMKPEIWSAIIQPIMIARQDGWVWFTGTPKGANDFKHKYDYARSTDDPKWAAFFLSASKSGIIPAESLEEAKRSTTQAFYEQEYECEFLESATQVFHRIRENIVMDVDNNHIPEHTFQLGIDLARAVDWTVITPIDVHTFKVLPQERFNQISWSIQKMRIEMVHMRFGKPMTYIDATGVGDPIVEELEMKLPNIVGVVFTENTRKELLTNLAIKLEQDIIKIPNDPELVSELQSFRYEVGEKGRIKMTAPEGAHDDRVMSLALAVKGLPERPLRMEETYIQHQQREFDPHATI